MSKKLIAAVDIGSSKICTIITSLEEGGPINVIGYSVVPSKGVKKGVIIDINDALNVIQESIAYAEKMAGIAISEAIVSVNGKSIFSNNTRGIVAVMGNEITEDDVRRVLESVKAIAVPPQLRKLVHILPREYVVDSQGGIKQPVGMIGSRLEVDAHVISSLSTAIYNINKIFEEISIRVIPVFAGLASSQAVLTDTEKELGVVVCDIGYGTTTITIYQGAISYSASVNLGAQAITNDLAVGLQITSEDAEKLKRNISALLTANNAKELPWGSNQSSYLKADSSVVNQAHDELSGLDYDEGDITLDVSSLQIAGLNKLSLKMFNEIVNCRLEELFSLISNNITAAGFSFKQPAGMVLTGGGAKLLDINKKASQFFGVPVRIGYPQGLTGPLIDEISTPEYSCVQGLVLMGLEIMTHETADLIYRDNVDKNERSILDKILSFFKNIIS